jgi:glycine/D-amino acid oxidase-like deaminating enzyme
VVTHLTGAAYRDLSYWMSSVDDDLTPQPSLEGDMDADVAIVGAGYTGLWTAYYLTRADPGIRVAIVEAEIAGYGASGRNGGWCSALLPQSPSALVRRHGRDAALALLRAMQSTVDEVGAVARAEKIDCHFAKGGTVTLVRSMAQRARARAELDEAKQLGLDLVWLDARDAMQRCGATDVLGATYTPHCATIHPARLVRGLARVVQVRGVRVFERTPATGIEPGIVHTRHGQVRADIVVRATEAYTARMPGLRRRVVPLYSLMIATEPLPPSFWDNAGLTHRETFSDYRHLLVYGQRTADGRLAFGGRGAPYHLGSRVRPEYDRVHRVHAAIRSAAWELFPGLGDARVTHAWGGPLAAPRDWSASVGIDRRTGLAWAGGYVGDGVGAANLAGRTLADLIRGVDSDLTALPWVGHRSPAWEPEPSRWIGINTATRLMGSADRTEARTGATPRRAKLVNRLLGR